MFTVSSLARDAGPARVVTPSGDEGDDMRFAFTLPRSVEECNETRARRHGYVLRCREPRGHDGAHRWTPELARDRDEGQPEPEPAGLLRALDRRVRSTIRLHRSA
jgi:hypothetical protein